MISTIFMFAFHLTNRLQANLIKETPICLLNRAMFNSRKIYVVNLEKGAEKNVSCWWICKWDSTVLRWLLKYILKSSTVFDIQENTNKELGFQLELLAYKVILKEVFRTCNVLPFSCTHLALWRERQGKRPKVHEKQKGYKNFFNLILIFQITTYLWFFNYFWSIYLDSSLKIIYN